MKSSTSVQYSLIVAFKREQAALWNDKHWDAMSTPETKFRRKYTFSSCVSVAMFVGLGGWVHVCVLLIILSVLLDKCREMDSAYVCL